MDILWGLLTAALGVAISRVWLGLDWRFTIPTCLIWGFAVGGLTYLDRVEKRLQVKPKYIVSSVSIALTATSLSLRALQLDRSVNDALIMLIWGVAAASYVVGALTWIRAKPSTNQMTGSSPGDPSK